MTADLTDRERAMLDFEARWWRLRGSKDAAIRAEFGISPWRYYQVLTALIDTDRALVHDPVLVHRLQDERDARSRVRTLRRLVALRDAPKRTSCCLHAVDG